MNIKNERVHALAKEAARRSGQSQTSALEAALTLYLASFEGTTDAQESEAARRVDIVHSLVAEFDAGLDDDARAALGEGTTSIYDQHGLPA